MRPTHLVHLIVICASAFATYASAEAAPPNSAEKELQSLQGEWSFESVETDGERRKPDEQSANSPLIIQDKQMRHGETKVSFTIDVSTNPRIIDVAVSKAGEPDRTFEGIYKLENDALTICLNLDDTSKQRPSEFVTKPDSKLILLGFTRRR